MSLVTWSCALAHSTNPPHVIPLESQTYGFHAVPNRFGISVAYCLAYRDATGAFRVKVTIHQADSMDVTLKIEGKLSGRNVPELEQAWRSLVESLDGRKLRIDLCGVTHVDGSGHKLLAQIHQQTGARFHADTPLTRFFAERAQGVFER